jgi:phosphatidate cytidylyltransferase
MNQHPFVVFMKGLRDAPPEQQVGFLFLILFGLLMIGSAVTALSATRERDPREQQRFDAFLRDLRAVWVASVLFWLAWVWGPVGATLLAGAVSFIALREFITLTHTTHADHRSLILAFFITLPLQYFLVEQRRFDLFSVFIPVYVFFTVPVLGALAGDPRRFLERTAKIQWGITVCVYGLSHAPALLLLDFPRYEGRGAFLVFFLVFVVGVAQIAYEALSRRLRRRPVARQISRSFSWRALWLGTFTAGVTGMLMFWITPFKPGQALVLGAVAGFTGLFGDFVVKALKRDAGVRRWGPRASITGAVGLLDRVAAICFAAPVFFHSVRWYFKLAV